ncbi:MAG: hypothetical protein OXI16_13510 [Chloroflexota bacterium]|nr:hypothetical protein [Chloroflexota bacterium]
MRNQRTHIRIAIMLATIAVVFSMSAYASSAGSVFAEAREAMSVLTYQGAREAVAARLSKDAFYVSDPDSSVKDQGLGVGEDETNSAERGTIDTYTVALKSDPNITSSISTSTALPMVITVMDMKIDGMEYKNVSASIAKPAEAEHLVEICFAGTSACDENSDSSNSSGWGKTVTVYFASTETDGSDSGSAITGHTDIYVWNNDQSGAKPMISVRAIDDEFDQIGADRYGLIQHKAQKTGTQGYGTTNGIVKYIPVKVDDNDSRGFDVSNNLSCSVVSDVDTCSITFSETAGRGAGTDSHRISFKLSSRPLLGAAKLTISAKSGTNNGDIQWAIGNDINCSTNSTWTTSDSVLKYNYNDGSDDFEWDANQSICINVIDDNIDRDDTVTLEVIASNEGTTKTDYDSGFVVTGTTSGSWRNNKTGYPDAGLPLAPSTSETNDYWDRSSGYTAPSSTIKKEIIITITNDDNAGIDISESEVEVDEQS